MARDERFRNYEVLVFDRYDLSTGDYLGRNFVRSGTAIRTTGMSFGPTTDILFTCEEPNAIYAHDLRADRIIWQSRYDNSGHPVYDAAFNRLYLRGWKGRSTLVVDPDTGTLIKEISDVGSLIPVAGGKYLISELQDSNKTHPRGFGLMDAATWELLDWVPWENKVRWWGGLHHQGNYAWVDSTPPSYEKGYSEMLVFTLENTAGKARLRVRSFLDLRSTSFTLTGGKLFVSSRGSDGLWSPGWLDPGTEEMTLLPKKVKLETSKDICYYGLLGGTCLINQFGTVKRLEDGAVLHKNLFSQAPPFQIAPEGHHSWQGHAKIDWSNIEHFD